MRKYRRELNTFYYILFICLFATPCFTQNKVLNASRTNEEIVIDGIMKEASWRDVNIDIATDFLEQSPTEGLDPIYKTEVRILFDDNNIYILGYCYDEHPDSILTQLGERDDRLNADQFTVRFDTYNKMIDAFTFSVTASGVQSDSRVSDSQFNAVWESAVQIVEDGWIAEIKIPYYSLRFPKSDEQVWRVNFERQVRRVRKQLQWSLVPRDVETSLNYWGILTGLNNIKDPLRLSLSPYVSTFTEFGDNTSSLGYGYGADLKLGLNESYTLDMTLLPDFSQVRSDNIVKNLGAFEVVFDEQRPFFQEGVELFNLGDLFYSRRIGGVPEGFSDAFSAVGSQEQIVDNPITSKLINVTKVSGRNSKGLGIGVMNAITDRSYATIENNLFGTSREVETNPLVNYSIVSFDQNLKNNSSVYLINLNTTRAGDYIDANVTAAGFSLITKNSAFSFEGNVKVSQRDTNLLDNLFSADEGDGLSYFLKFSKISGNWKYALSSENISPDYNPNDLGVNFRTNVRNHELKLEYNKYNPFWILNGSYNSITLTAEQDYTTGELLKKKYRARYFFLFPSFVGLAIEMSSQIGDGIDLFESRVPGQKFIIPEFYYNGIDLSTDYRKPFALDVEIGYGEGYFTDYVVNHYFQAQLEPRIRVNDKLELRPSINYTSFLNGAGFAGYFDGEPKYGVRDVRTLTNILQGKYLFKNNLSLTLRIRHYWSYGLYDYYGDLDEEGYIIPDDSFTGNADFNFNAFNTDLIFAWQFAPGSFLNVVYKNALQRDEQDIELSYFNNLKSVFNEGQQNTLTMKLIYFLDTVSAFDRVSNNYF